MKLNLKLKTLAVAVALAAAGAVQASPINIDNISPSTLGTGDGVSGQLWLAVIDPTAAQSIVLNTGLTTGQFMNSNGSLINTFSVADPGLLAFFNAHTADFSQMRWNLGAIVNGDPTLGNPQREVQAILR